MPSDLERFRDHARRMSMAGHKTECRKPETNTQGWRGKYPDPACGGCNPPADQALWEQLAAEVDEHLARQVQEVLPVIDDDQLDLLEVTDA